MATDKQERAMQIYVANRGKSVSAAMREAGYSEATAKNPKNNLTDRDVWKELLDKYLPDKKLAAAHKKLLTSQRLDHMVFPLGMDQADIKKLLNSVGCTPKKSRSARRPSTSGSGRRTSRPAPMPSSWRTRSRAKSATRLTSATTCPAYSTRPPN